MPQRYTTEIRGDGVTRTWVLPHGLRPFNLSVILRDAANRDLSRTAQFTWPSEHEVAITFAVPPPLGRVYQIEVVTQPKSPKQ